MKKKIHLLPSVFTAFGLSCGLFVIFKINMTPIGGANLQVLTATAGILLLASVADVLDGTIARAMNAQSEFGGLFDSLADAITFGVAPSVVVLKSFTIEPWSNLSFFLTTSAMLFSVCGVLRLVRFTMTIDTTLNESEKMKNFIGLPIPAAAAAVVSANLFFVSGIVFQFSEISRGWVMTVSLFFLGYLMISRLQFPSIKGLRLKVTSFQVVFLTVLFAAILFYGLLYYFPLVFFSLTWSYVIIALILSLINSYKT